MIPIVLVCLDGVSREYVRSSSMPSLRRVERNGTSATCRAMIPTIKNVNNASILGGSVYVYVQKDVYKALSYPS